jgi:RNA-binding protein
MPKLEITAKERSTLRAASHPLRPVVQIGDRGLTEAVLKEIDVNLKAHHLIKIRVAGEERDAREAMLEAICQALSCAPVHHLGKTLIIYRPDATAASAQSPMPTRAVRKPSEPYTPKKQAATGATRTRETRKTERAARKPQREAPTAARARSAASREPATHNIPRRNSALSLKAGARKHLSRREH